MYYEEDRVPFDQPDDIAHPREESHQGGSKPEAV
ncbi:hypothetical protein BCM02_105436 [Paenibacillus methanolicus]|uniref:Uncharacterized protein n=1 Tax=Paenibacillus methanolicus TaxID=582686 RepID=A0A5S5C6U2_9BACL|nr:hypothetical protein BCM02_105436 [Paenibacillus methanolicus]